MKKKIMLAVAGVAIFIIYTVLVKCVDVQPIGPEGSVVGFAAVNGWFHEVTGVRMGLYELTDWVSYLSFVLVAIFGVMGLVQWVRRRRLMAVDAELLALGVFYILLLGAFVVFEFLKINYRPVLIEGVLEASYPSSTTMLAIGVLGTALAVIPKYLKGAEQKVALVVCGALLGFLVGGRLLSGVHWLTDIVGGVLLAVALINIYELVVALFAEKRAEDLK